MVEPRIIGLLRPSEAISSAGRKRSGRAVVPGSDEIRTVDLFNAAPVLNRRVEIITPDNSRFRFLRFARIALDTGADGYAPVFVELAGDHEAVFYVARGMAHLQVSGERYTLGMGDVLYIGLGKVVTIESDEACDVCEYRASDCSTEYPVQLVRHADIEGSELAADVGTKRPMTVRTVYKLVDQNVQACRLLFGDTYMQHPGGVGSYPPHFHGPDGPNGFGDDAKEEIYHFRCESDIEGDTPYVLQNCSRPGEAVNTYVHVFDDEAIDVTPSYHDTMAPPPVRFMFTWCLGAFTQHHRDWAEVLNRPGYADEW